MRCASCDHENRPLAAFCEGCGAALARVCANCGTALRPSAAFCDACGVTTRPAGEAAPAVPSGPGLARALPASFAAGRYQVRRFLGEGGKKRVYLAHDTRLERDVAVALIKTDSLDEAGILRIRREARAMGKLGDHPHIVTIYDVGEEGEQTYIVSQYMSGGSVDDLLQKGDGHRIPLDRALQIAEQICQALGHAHERGIVHRDLKPANVWLTHDGTAKLGDFGLALALDRSRLTAEGMMVGTATYMPPEQALGRPPDVRSDLYTLGAMLYEMVTGRPPFVGDDSVAIISQHINTPPVSPSWHNPELPRALEALILQLLAKRPEERPESAVAVRHTLTAASSTAAARTEAPADAEVNPLDRLAGGVFVGRERELDELRAGLDDALSGRGRFLMLVGEPGIGKTRAAEELATYASLRGAQVLVGRCYEGEGAPAYWPWIQIVRAYVHDRDPAGLMSEMGSGAGEIARVVSEVRERLPIAPPASADPEQARFRLFDSLTTFLKNAAKNKPLLLILDDLHWADKPSLLLLLFLVRELRGARLLIVGTYRDAGLGRQHPLSQTLGELARERLSHRVLLRGLTEDDVRRFIERTAGLTPPEALVAAVYKETEGNPFFVNEMVRLLVTDARLERPEEVSSWSMTIPQGVREVIGRRLDHLSAACNGVLSIASVIGREFTFETLMRLCDLPEDRLVEELEQALDACVITEVPHVVGRYAFSHALIRETLYEELTTTRRARLHRAVGEALEALYGERLEPHLAELAYHFGEAGQGGNLDKAIDYATRAGDRAVAQMGYEQAARHYEMALQTVELREPRDEALRCELFLTLGDALWGAGEPDKAKETLRRAADTARAIGRPEQLARAALGFGGRTPGFGSAELDHMLVGLLEEALGALDGADSALRAKAMALLAESIRLSDPEGRRVALCQEAVEMARRTGDPAALSYVLRRAHWAIWGPDNLEERLAIATDAVRLADSTGDPVTMAEAHFWLMSDLLEMGDVDRLEKETATAARIAATTREPYIQWGSAAYGALHAILEGRFDEGERLAQEALKIGLRAGNQAALMSFGAHIAAIRREQGRSREVEVGLQGFIEEFPLILAWRCGLALLYCETEREAEARVEFERLAADDFSALPRDPWWLSCMTMVAEVCNHLADVPRAATLYSLLLPYAGRCAVTAGVQSVCFGSVARSLGLLARIQSRWEEAEGHFEAAIAVNTRLGSPSMVAHTQSQYARMLLTRDRPGDREKALALLTHALDVAQALGMKPLVERALGLKLRAQGVDSRALQTSIDTVATAVERERPDLRSHAAPDGTLTILFSDIEGSTAMVERLGDQRWLQILHAHNAIVRREVGIRHGHEVKAQGDGFMVVFPSARRAVLCAIHIQRAFAAHNGEHGEEPIRVRIGLHTGEAINEGDDFFGRNVNLAARITGEARGGEIMVSSVLKELTESAGDIRFDGGREVALKGLSGTQRVFAVDWT